MVTVKKVVPWSPCEALGHSKVVSSHSAHLRTPIKRQVNSSLEVKFSSSSVPSLNAMTNAPRASDLYLAAYYCVYISVTGTEKMVHETFLTFMIVNYSLSFCLHYFLAGKLLQTQIIYISYTSLSRTRWNTYRFIKTSTNHTRQASCRSPLLVPDWRFALSPDLELASIKPFGNRKTCWSLAVHPFLFHQFENKTGLFQILRFGFSNADILSYFIRYTTFCTSPSWRFPTCCPIRWASAPFFFYTDTASAPSFAVSTDLKRSSKKVSVCELFGTSALAIFMVLDSVQIWAFLALLLSKVKKNSQDAV